MTAWRELRPSVQDRISSWATYMREHKTAFNEGITKYFNWGGNSGTSAGVPVLSSNSLWDGMWRPYYDVESNVSGVVDTWSTPGHAYITSDTSRLLVVHSTISGVTNVASIFGGTRAVHSNVASTDLLTSSTKSLCKNVICFGKSERTLRTTSVQTVFFNQGLSTTTFSSYEVPPTVVITGIHSRATAQYIWSITSLSIYGFEATEFQNPGMAGSSSSEAEFYWTSIGTASINV